MQALCHPATSEACASKPGSSVVFGGSGGRGKGKAPGRGEAAPTPRWVRLRQGRSHRQGLEGAGDGARLRALSCPGSKGMTVNRSSRHRAETALTLLLKMRWEVLVFGFLCFLVC